jgi:hypothetical protein
MPYFGDYNAGMALYKTFTTVDSTGAPASLASGTMSVFKNNTTTPSTSGTSLSANFGSLVGLNLVTVDLSTDPTFYANGNDYAIVIKEGFIGSIHVLGYEVGHFSIGNRSPLRPNVAGRTVSVESNGLIDANMVQNGPSGTGTNQTARDLGANIDVAISSRSTLGGVAQTGDAFARIGAPSGSSISADLQSNRVAIGNIPTAPLLSADARIPATILASQSDILINRSGTNLIPTNPLLTSDSRVPSTLIASQSDVLINRSGTNAIPTNPLLTNDGRLPSTKIASQNDVLSNISGTNALQASVALIPITTFLTGDTRLPTTKIASQADVLIGISGTNTIPVLVDTLLSANHTTGTWAGATSQQIDSQLSSSHGTGTWGGGNAPSVAQIDAQLSTSHGTGTWGGGNAPSVGQIDTQLSSTHGGGAWGAIGTGGTLSIVTASLVDTTTGNPVPNAPADLYATTGTPPNKFGPLIQTVLTDVFGVATFSNLTAGTYWITFRPDGYTPVHITQAAA